MRHRLDTISVKKVRVVVSVSLSCSDRDILQTIRIIAKENNPWRMLRQKSFWENSGSRGLRGGRRIMLLSGLADSKTRVQVGSIINSRKTIWAG